MEKRLRTFKIIWLAVAGQWVFAGVLCSCVTPLPPTAFAHASNAGTFFAALALAAGLDAVVALLMPGWVLKSALSKLDGSSGRKDKPTSDLFADPVSIRPGEFAAYQQPFLVGLGLSESVALFGVPVWYLGYGLNAAAPFFVAGALLMLARFPTEQSITRALEKARAAASS